MSQKVLSQFETLAAEHDGTISLGLSVDQYHQPKIPPQSIANIISQYRHGDFTHISLAIHSFKEQQSFDVVGDVYASCETNGIDLIESNDAGYIYPTLKTEFIKFTPENFPLIVEKLKLPRDADKKTILGAISFNLKMAEDLRDLVHPTVIARKVDIGEGLANYLIFPQERYLLDLVVEKRILNAGRARKNGRLETALSTQSRDYLVIAPNGQAYAYPAHISAEPGVIIGNKPLHQVVMEVRRKWFTQI